MIYILPMWYQWVSYFKRLDNDNLFARDEHGRLWQQIWNDIHARKHFGTERQQIRVGADVVSDKTYHPTPLPPPLTSSLYFAVWPLYVSRSLAGKPTVLSCENRNKGCTWTTSMRFWNCNSVESITASLAQIRLAQRQVIRFA